MADYTVGRIHHLAENRRLGFRSVWGAGGLGGCVSRRRIGSVSVRTGKSGAGVWACGIGYRIGPSACVRAEASAESLRNGIKNGSHPAQDGFRNKTVRKD